MNLQCDKIDLVQTPTYVSYMCMVGPNGEIPNELTGNAARRAIHIYCYWRLEQAQSAFNHDNKDRDLLDYVRDEVKRIKEILKKERSIKVWVI